MILWKTIMERFQNALLCVRTPKWFFTSMHSLAVCTNEGSCTKPIVGAGAQTNNRESREPRRWSWRNPEINGGHLEFRIWREMMHFGFSIDIPNKQKTQHRPWPTRKADGRLLTPNLAHIQIFCMVWTSHEGTNTYPGMDLYYQHHQWKKRYWLEPSKVSAKQERSEFLGRSNPSTNRIISSPRRSTNGKGSIEETNSRATWSP